MNRAPCSVLIRVVLACFAALATVAGGSPAAAQTAIAVTLDAPSAVSGGDVITLRAHSSIDVGPTPYYIRIYDDDSGALLVSCGSGTTCAASPQAAWPSSGAEYVRHFRAEVGAARAASSVDIRPYDWGLHLTVDHPVVKIPDDTYKVTASTNRDVTGTPYYIKIYDADTGAVLVSCGSGAACSITRSADWVWNEQPPRRYRAEVSSPSLAYIPASDGPQSVTAIPFIFTVSLSYLSNSDGSTRLTATTNRDVGPSPYYIDILDSVGKLVAHCGGGTTCTATVTNPQGYRAAVRRSDGTAFGVDRSDEGVAVAAVGSLLAGLADPCVVVAAIPAQSRLSSSVGDLGAACLEWQEAGVPAERIAALVVRYAPAPGLAWLLINATEVQDGTWTPDTSTWPPAPPPVTLDPPATMPSAWAGPLEATMAGIKARNAEADLTSAQVEAIATHCLWESAQASNGLDICNRDKLPIWVTGTDVPEASRHDARALLGHLGWFRLNHRMAAANPSPRDWTRTAAECQTRDPDVVQDCDEFPYFATEQGGGLAEPRPDLMLIDRTDNRRQGSLYYWRLIYRCGMRSGASDETGEGAQFLVIPIPASPMAVPTTGLCNGKTGITDEDPPDYAPTNPDAP